MRTYAGCFEGAPDCGNPKRQGFLHKDQIAVFGAAKFGVIIAFGRGKTVADAGALKQDAGAAIAHLEAAVPNELGIPATNFVALFGSLYSAYVRGQAFQALGRSAEAAAEFQKILEHRGLVFSDPVGAMARLHLARALTASGDRAKAHAAYQDLLTLWNAADADLALPRQAKVEAANLP